MHNRRNEHFDYEETIPGQTTLYRNKDLVKKNVDSEVAVDELINLLKESSAWVEPGKHQIVFASL
jgi:(E)-4-hydroxy-3-methylbut-2-enyl-diphosphate synthase